MLRVLLAALAVALPGAVLAAPAQAGLTTAQAQAEFNKQVKSDAAEGLSWRDCGSLAPLISKSSRGGWVAEGDYVVRGRLCALTTQRCSWKGWLSPSGYWVEPPRKWNCR